MLSLLDKVKSTFPIKNLSIIVACDENGTIGKADGLPWDKIEGDLPRFKELTRGKTIIMGSKTFKTLPEPLEGRYHIVLSRFWSIEERAKLNIQTARSRALGIDFVSSVNEIVEIMKYEPEEVFIIGGAEVYSLLLPYVTKVYVTRIPAIVEGDTKVDWLAMEKLPELGRQFRCLSIETSKDKTYGLNHFYVYKRKTKCILGIKFKNVLRNLLRVLTER